MIRGTTPTHTFTLPVDVALVKSIRVLYGQGGALLFGLDTDRFTLEGNTAQVTLTQEETLKFDAAQLAEVQLRILTTDGAALASQPLRAYVGKLLENEVLE